LARRLGATDAQLQQVERGSFSDFEPAWQSALMLAEVVTPTRGELSEGGFEALAAHWSAAQIVEILSVICLFNYFNRFAETLRIPPTV
jgi:alkylhydroperoxidase family enzyme